MWSIGRQAWVIAGEDINECGALLNTMTSSKRILAGGNRTQTIAASPLFWPKTTVLSHSWAATTVTPRNNLFAR
jgi:hypothetical protein